MAETSNNNCASVCDASSVEVEARRLRSAAAALKRACATYAIKAPPPTAEITAKSQSACFVIAAIASGAISMSKIGGARAGDRDRQTARSAPDVSDNGGDPEHDGGGGRAGCPLNQRAARQRGIEARANERPRRQRDHQLAFDMFLGHIEPAVDFRVGDQQQRNERRPTHRAYAAHNRRSQTARQDRKRNRRRQFTPAGLSRA